MRKRAKNPPSLGEVLGNFLRRSGLTRKIQEQKILNSWDKAVGEAIAERTQPVNVKNRVLRVKVTNSVWMQELQFMKDLIIKKLHEQIGENFLQDLRFFIGEVDPSEVGAKKKKKKEGGRINGEVGGLSEAEKERIGRALAEITDPEMREILERIYAKGLSAVKRRWPK
jgi:hypothetical protein